MYTQYVGNANNNNPFGVSSVGGAPVTAVRFTNYKRRRNANGIDSLHFLTFNIGYTNNQLTSELIPELI